MTKTVTIDWKGGSRRIELRDPGKMARMHQMGTAPSSFTMSPKTLAWINSTIKMGTKLSMDEIESVEITDGFSLLGEVTNYWTDIMEGDAGDDLEKGGEGKLEGLDLNENGAVDLEEML